MARHLKRVPMKATDLKTKPTATKWKVLLLDDHPMLRAGLAELINEQSDLEVSAEAQSATEAAQAITQCLPDLAIVDLSLGGKSGLEFIKDLHALHPEVKILVMSMHNESIYAERVLKAGARGYVMKTAGGETVLQAIRDVLAGRISVSPSLAAQIMNNFAGGNQVANQANVKGLTDREFEVFTMIGEGCGIQQVADRLHISPKTVDVHRQHVKAKLGLEGNTELIQYAVRWLDAQNRN